MAATARKKRAGSTRSQLPVYRGEFGVREAERLLWRAGFGPAPGEARKVAKLGLKGAVHYLTRPRSRKLVGPEPRVDGQPIAPTDLWGHDTLWWMDRMVRSKASGVERMTLIFHDWFATSRAGADVDYMIAQNELFRRDCFGTFSTLLMNVTKDPAMLQWLNGTDNSKDEPNENYAREMMELFTLGAGNGYTETDVRELARALTGFTSRWSESQEKTVDFRFDPERHDDTTKRVFGQQGNYDWRDAVRIATGHRRHPEFFVTKLWSYFIPTPPSTADRKQLERLYIGSRRSIRTVTEAILMHPRLYSRERMVKPPIVYITGLLRGLGRPIDTDSWSWLTEIAGQRPFTPPSVAGWDDSRWLDTATWRGRWIAANSILDGYTVDTDNVPAKLLASGPDELVGQALAKWGSPTISTATRKQLVAFAARGAALGSADEWKTEPYTAMTFNALLMLIATSPDLQTS